MSRNDVPVIISINEILAALKRGVTRLNRDRYYSPERGSIQSIYGLTATEVTELFLDPRLANKKTIVPRPSRIVIAEDQEPVASEDIEENEATTNPITSENELLYPEGMTLESISRAMTSVDIETAIVNHTGDMGSF